MDGKPSNPNPNPNPNPNRNQKQAFHFLRALDRIKHSSSSRPQISSRLISSAAYASMAHAAGPRRAWSRAVLRRICRRPVPRGALLIHRRVRIARPRHSAEPRHADDLRRHVPGGKGMDFCSLLEETANYMQCLAAQVRLMQTVVDSASP